MLGVVGCGSRVAAPPPAVTRTSIVLAGPTVAAESLRVAATDSFALTPGVTARVVSNRGALDFIDGGGDVLVTNRRAVIAYAATRADYATIPLPWDREYVLVASTAPVVPDMVDAVRVDARAASTQCPMDTGPAKVLPIVYAADDSVARALAERLIGLGIAIRGAPALLPAYIVAWPIDSVSCTRGDFRVVPLVDTRSELIVRRGAVGVAADSAGHLRLQTKP
jgi:hypothetical protein